MTNKCFYCGSEKNVNRYEVDKDITGQTEVFVCDSCRSEEQEVKCDICEGNEVSDDTDLILCPMCEEELNEEKEKNEK